MQNLRTRDIHLPILILLLLFGTIPFRGQQKDVAKEFDVDSTLYAYYQRCKNELQSPAVLSMADTLFRMAEEKHDQRMQAVALSTKVDYLFYNNKDADSLVDYVNRVKEFAMQTQQPKYYFFIWSQRLITYYTRQRQYNIALYETEKMMKEATQQQYMPGMADAYVSLSNIYGQKGMYDLAAQYKEKQIEINKQEPDKSYNLARNYFQLATYYYYLQNPDRMREILDEAQGLIKTSSQQFQYYLKEAQYYNFVKNHKKEWEFLQMAGRFRKSNKEVWKESSEYYMSMRRYYGDQGQYHRALVYQDSLDLFFNQRKANYYTGLLNRAKLLRKVGNCEKAASYYERYINQLDSINRVNEDITTGEFAAMLDVERLNNEKNELTHTMHRTDMKNKRYTILGLSILLILLLVFFYREHQMNKRLKASQQELSEKNQELKEYGQQLAKAKNVAEKASTMKSEFIQNMSHEIRTPLNSIVGFSQIISSMYSEQNETKEFAQIIEQNSNHLLHLINDVLDLSNLDSDVEIPTDTPTDASALCHEALLGLHTSGKEISLRVAFEADEFVFLSNPTRLALILSHLLANAYKFTDKGEILLGWQRNNTQTHILFSVTDTGIGIPADKHEQVFERFSKLDNFVPGTGLGLSICRLSAEKMGGRLEVDATYRQGARFVLTLPLKQPAEDNGMTQSNKQV